MTIYSSNEALGGRSFARRFFGAMGWAVLLSVTLTVALLAAVVSALGWAWHDLSQAIAQGALSGQLGEGVRVTVDGNTVSLGPWQTGHLWVAVCALVLAVVLVLFIVFTVLPMVLLMAGAVALLSLFIGVGSAVLAVGGAALLVLSPVLLVAGLLWLIFRKTSSVKMAA